jgi:hypothetical protein
MAVAFGSVGTGAIGNGTSSTAPTAPASIAAGDSLIFVLSMATVGSSGGSTVPATPAGWTLLGSGKNESTTVGQAIYLYGKTAVGSDTMPTTSWTTITKWAAQCFRYTGASGLPTAFFGAGQSGTTSTSNPCTIAQTVSNQWVSYIFCERSTTNTSYAAISGLTQRGTTFGSGGGSPDIGFYDTAGTISGTTPSKTAVAGTGGSWGENAILVWPADLTTVVATRATTWNTFAATVGTRATTWTTRTAVIASRATTWTTAASVAATRATAWNALKAVAPTRATSWGTLAVVPFTGGGGTPTLTYIQGAGGGATTTQLVTTPGAPGWTPANGSVVVVGLLLTNTSGAPGAGTMTDNWADTGGTAWAEVASLAIGTTDRISWWTRKIGTSPGAGWPTHTGSSGTSQIRNGRMYISEVNGVASPTPVQTTTATGNTTGTLTASFTATPAASSMVLSEFLTTDGTLVTPDAAFTLIDTLSLSTWNSAVAYEAASVAQSHTWQNESATHCGIVAIELPVASGSTTRATTWKVAAPVVSSRPTTWGVGGTVVASRATTWGTFGRVTTSRATTWITYKAIATTRATTWTAFGAIAVTRPTTWAALATLSATRSTSWIVSAVATATRATTWNVASTLTSVGKAVSTSWNVDVAVAASRATSWTTAAAVASGRATAWVVLVGVAKTVSTTWRVDIVAPIQPSSFGQSTVSSPISGRASTGPVTTGRATAGDVVTGRSSVLTIATGRGRADEL